MSITPRKFNEKDFLKLKADLNRDTWRIFRIMAEFVESFEKTAVYTAGNFYFWFCQS